MVLTHPSEGVKVCLHVDPFTIDSIRLSLFFSGEPLPSVVWYMDDKLLDDTYQQTFEGVVKNDLTIRRLERVHTLSKLRCLASNNNLTRAVETSVTLKMLCKYQSDQMPHFGRHLEF